jgi:hypothetical protein
MSTIEKERREVLTARVSPAVRVELRRLAVREETTIGALVRRALRLLLAEAERANEPGRGP